MWYSVGGRAVKGLFTQLSGTTLWIDIGICFEHFSIVRLSFFPFQIRGRSSFIFISMNVYVELNWTLFFFGPVFRTFRCKVDTRRRLWISRKIKPVREDAADGWMYTLLACWSNQPQWHGTEMSNSSLLAIDWRKNWLKSRDQNWRYWRPKW